MRTLILIIGFTIICRVLFNFQNLLYPLGILPSDLYRYPPSELSSSTVFAYKFILNFMLPLIVTTLFLYLSKIPKRITLNWGYYLFSSATLIYVLKYLLLYLTTFIEGGGATYAAGYFLGFLGIPAYILLVIGALKVLITLHAAPNINDKNI